ncbi:MAG: hypothetical protein H0V40_11845 [Actinobacteria bacterium]|nr:hypothetical protein [Actinomycetota bacterium]
MSPPQRLSDGQHRLIDRIRVPMHRLFGRTRSNQSLRDLLERIDQGVVAIGRDLEVSTANTAACRLLGAERLAAGDPLPEPWPAFPLRRFAAELFEPQAVGRTVRVSPGAGRSLAVTGLPAGRQGSAVLVIADHSELERLESADRDFVIDAAHELRTPVAAISSAVAVLQGGAKDTPDERDRFLEIVERQAARLGHLAHALLVLARAETGGGSLSLVPVHVPSLLEDLVVDLQTRERVEVEVSCPPDLRVLGDPDLLEQIVSNLAVNAAKHTERGRIKIVGRRLSDELAAVEVVDTGAGIPEPERERVFERFFRGEGSEGFGLGLSIVRQAVGALGGSVEIVPGGAGGTIVRVELRAAPASGGMLAGGS